MSMIKTALKFNIVLFILILIVSMPLVYADWSDLTVTVDTNVVTYDEVAFIQQYKGLYYIDYFNGKPYIQTDVNKYNQFLITYDNIYCRDLDCLIDDNQFILNVDESCNYCYIHVTFKDYTGKFYIEFFPNGVFSIYINRGPSEIIERYLSIDKPIYVGIDNSSSDINQIYVFVYPKNIGESSFEINIYNQIVPYIDRPAETYIYERSDYTRIGAIILDSYNNFVDSLLNPLDTITGWLKDLGNYIWSTIKRIIDPEGIFLK